MMRPSLRASIALLTTWGASWALGPPGVWVLFARGNPGWLFFSRRADEAYLGTASNPALEDLTFLHAQLEGAAIGACGLLILALTWWGVRRGARWTIGALALILVPFALAVPVLIAEYASRNVTLRPGDIMPFLYIMLFVGGPGLALAWWGTRS